MTQKALIRVVLPVLVFAFLISACRNPRQITFPTAAADTETYTATPSATDILSPDTPTSTRTSTAVLTSTFTPPQDTATNTPVNSATDTPVNSSTGTQTATATVTSTPAQPVTLKDSTYNGICSAPLMPTPHSTIFAQDPEAAQLIKASSSYTITRVEAYVYAVVVPNQPGNLWAEIQGVDGVNGVPDDIPLSNGVSAMLDINAWLTDARDGKVIFYFSGCPVGNGQDYSVVFKWDSGQAQLLQFPICIPDAYPDGYLLLTGTPPAPYQNYYQAFYGKWNKWFSCAMDDMFIDIYGY